MANGVGIGIDVAKDKVDVASTDGWSATFPQTVEGLTALAEAVGVRNPHRVVLEASGGYERGPLAALFAAGCPVVLLEPARARAFARSQRKRAKTDPIDARVLAQMALVGVEEDPLWEPLDATLAVLRDVVLRRQAVLCIIDGETKRLASASDAIRASITRVLEALLAERRYLDEQINTLIASAAEIKEKAEVLEGVRGVGRTTAAVLLVSVPELGRLSRGAVASLVGVAPMNNESGTWTGKRVTQGGRILARRALYMAALAAIRHNPHIKDFYARLKARGKPGKVALVACMRKLLIYLNNLLRPHAKAPMPMAA